MKESYREDDAHHSGPESCLDGPRGRGEALTGESTGSPIELRNHLISNADPVLCRGRQHQWQRPNASYHWIGKRGTRLYELPRSPRQHATDTGVLYADRSVVAMGDSSPQSEGPQAMDIRAFLSSAKTMDTTSPYRPSLPRHSL